MNLLRHWWWFGAQKLIYILIQFFLFPYNTITFHDPTVGHKRHNRISVGCRYNWVKVYIYQGDAVPTTSRYKTWTENLIQKIDGKSLGDSHTSTVSLNKICNNNKHKNPNHFSFLVPREMCDYFFLFSVHSKNPKKNKISKTTTDS